MGEEAYTWSPEGVVAMRPPTGFVLPVAEASAEGRAWILGVAEALKKLLEKHGAFVIGIAWSPADRAVIDPSGELAMRFRRAIDRVSHTQAERKTARIYGVGRRSAYTSAPACQAALGYLQNGYRQAPALWELATLTADDAKAVDEAHGKLGGVLQAKGIRAPQSQAQQDAEEEQALVLQVWEERVLTSADVRLPANSLGLNALNACLPTVTGGHRTGDAPNTPNNPPAPPAPPANNPPAPPASNSAQQKTPPAPPPQGGSAAKP